MMINEIGVQVAASSKLRPKMLQAFLPYIDPEGLDTYLGGVAPAACPPAGVPKTLAASCQWHPSAFQSIRRTPGDLL